MSECAGVTTGPKKRSKDRHWNIDQKYWNYVNRGLVLLQWEREDNC